MLAATGMLPASNPVLDILADRLGGPEMIVAKQTNMVVFKHLVGLIL